MTIKNILIKIILVILFLIFLCELDRRFMIPHNFSNYYIKNFPKQILHGIQAQKPLTHTQDTSKKLDH